MMFWQKKMWTVFTAWFSPVSCIHVYAHRAEKHHYKSLEFCLIVVNLASKWRRNWIWRLFMPPAVRIQPRGQSSTYNESVWTRIKSLHIERLSSGFCRLHIILIVICSFSCRLYFYVYSYFIIKCTPERRKYSIYLSIYLSIWQWIVE